MGLAGIEFQALNRQWAASVIQPVNMAAAYGVTISRAIATGKVWRCIGAYHLTPSENRGRRNVYVDVLDESGRRIPGAAVRWRWYDNAPPQTKVLDKPASEPGCDIDIDKNGVYSVWMDLGGLTSDMVARIHSRHADEPGPNGENWNSVGHHSFYVCFQRQAATIIPPIDPPVVPPSNAAILAQLDVVQAELAKLRGLL